jgi:8-hydroxy-5-deazaflavin:NADPH oxidoreductase
MDTEAASVFDAVAGSRQAGGRMSAGEQTGRKLRADVQRNRAALLETAQRHFRGVPAGTPGRLAIPVAGDSEEARRVAMQLVDDTGFDPYEVGTLADSWRQQPNGPAYCTELTLDELPAALAAADRVKDSAIRDSLPERFAALGANPIVDQVVEMNRAAHRRRRDQARGPRAGQGVSP